jgi:hypothetical protein
VQILGIVFKLEFLNDLLQCNQIHTKLQLYVTSLTASVVWCSEFLATDPVARVRFPALPEKKVVVLERGALSLVSTTEELLDRKVAAPV